MIIDCDTQGHVSTFLGLAKSPGLYRWIVQERDATEVLTKTDFDSLQIIPGDGRTLDLNKLLATSDYIRPATALSAKLAEINSVTDLCLIDTAPSMAEIQVAALSAADYLLIPTIPEYASEEGLATLLGTVERMQERGAAIQLLGILPTMIQTRRTEHKETYQAWRDRFGEMMLPPIRNLTELAEAPGRGQPIWTYSPRSQGAEDYKKVFAAVRRRLYG